jgi:hypothetical protein
VGHLRPQRGEVVTDSPYVEMHAAILPWARARARAGAGAGAGVRQAGLSEPFANVCGHD